MSTPTFSQYWEKSLCVIPEKDGIPVFAWSKIYKENYKPTPEELLDWDLAIDYNYGLVTGSCSGIIAIDLDYVSEVEQQRAIELLGDTPCKKKGSKGITLLYKYNNERNCNWIKDNVVKAELLSTGRKTTIPPSLHRKTGKPYKWIGTPLIDCYDKLPTLPANYMELLDSLFSIIRAPEKEYVRSDFDLRPSYNDAVEALNYCDPNCSNSDWVQIGMAFRAEVGDAGFTDFDAWSSKGKSYDKGSIRSRWRSFNSHSIGYGTLIHFAKQGGYVPPQREKVEIVPPTIIDNWEETFEEKLIAIESENELPEFYTNAPHHIKEICDWITSTAICPQPILSLGSTLAVLGFIMAKDFEFNGLRPHLYTANIAYSGDGKGHLNRCVRGILKVAENLQHISYGFTSDTSILNDLKRTNEHKAFFLTDELQTLLHSISKRSNNSAEGRAVAVLLQAYTEPEVRSVTKANTKENPTIIVDNPTIGICGYTTPHMFETCLSSTEVLSGFVGRLSTFRGNKFIPDENLNHDNNAWKNPPANIVAIISDIKNNRHREFLPDDQSFVYGTKEIPSDCTELIRGYRKKLIDKRNALRAQGNPLEALYARAAEIMVKYAIIASKGKKIDEACINWAISVVEYNVSILYDVALNFADSTFERNKNKLVEFVKKCGGIVTKTKIAQNFKGFDDARKRQEAIDDLVLAEVLEKVESKEGGRTKTGYRLKDTTKAP